MQHMQGILKPNQSHHQERIASPPATSSNPTSGSTPKPKRPKYSTSTGKKRFAPKTRTGCLTCRARRVKCTEERPTCLRCVKGDYTCKYATDQTKYFPSKQFQTNLRSWTESSNDSSDDSADNKLASSLQPSYGTAEETYYLNRFLDISAPWFSSYIDSGFFFKLLPQRSWHHPALKHSLVALAMASEAARLPFATSEFAFSHEKHQARHHWHYAQALQEIYKARDINEDVVLLSSAVFWLHDNITKNSRTAMVHLQGFLRILTERKLRRQKLSWKEDEWEATILRGLVFSADVADEAFAETLEPNLMKNIRTRLNDPRYSRSFKKFSAVRDELRLGLTAIPYSSLSGTPESPSSNNAVTAAELRTYFERWYRAFSSFAGIGEIDKVLLECHYVCVALSLQVHESGQKSPKVNDPQSIHRMEYILSMLETIDFKEMVQPPLGKDVEMPIIPILTQVIVLSSRGDIRAKAFKMLRELNRVEGLWASDVVADMMSIAYPLEGGSGPWSRSQPIKSKVRNSQGSDKITEGVKGDHRRASSDLRYQQQNTGSEIPDAWSQLQLQNPPYTAEQLQQQSMLQDYITSLEASLGFAVEGFTTQGQNTHALNDFLSASGVEHARTVLPNFTPDPQYWMNDCQPMTSISAGSGIEAFEEIVNASNNIDQGAIEAAGVSNLRLTADPTEASARGSKNSPDARPQVSAGRRKKSENINVSHEAGEKADQEVDNEQAKARKGATMTRSYRLGGDYSYVNHIAGAVTFSPPSYTDHKNNYQTSKQGIRHKKPTLSPKVASPAGDAQSGELTDFGANDRTATPPNFHSGDDAERELAYGMGGQGFNLQVQ